MFRLYLEVLTFETVLILQCSLACLSICCVDCSNYFVLPGFAQQNTVKIAEVKLNVENDKPSVDTIKEKLDAAEQKREKEKEKKLENVRKNVSNLQIIYNLYKFIIRYVIVGVITFIKLVVIMLVLYLSGNRIIIYLFDINYPFIFYINL